MPSFSFGDGDMFILKTLAFPIMLFIYWPGKVMLWFEYMYPAKGQVWAAKRRYKSPIVCVMSSLVFWSVLIASIYAMAVTNHNKTAQAIMYELQRLDSHGYAKAIIINLDNLIKEHLQ